MRPRIVAALAALLVVVSVGGLQASAGGGSKFSATLTGYEETPTLSVAGTGSFSAQISRDETSVSYTLSYSSLTGPALAAHIHLGMPAIAGGVIAFLCDTDAGTAQIPDCPGAGGTVSGSIEAADVIGPAGQGITAGEFEELVAAMRFGATYANVHTTAFPSGEIRGQIG
jgi:hypothetical protein